MVVLGTKASKLNSEFRGSVPRCIVRGCHDDLEDALLVAVWSKKFFEPIILPDGRKLVTLRDAATYVTSLPKSEHNAEQWRTATQVLLLVAERDGPEINDGADCHDAGAAPERREAGKGPAIVAKGRKSG